MTAPKTRELNSNEKLSVFNANVIIIIIIIIRYIIVGILIISFHNQDCCEHSAFALLRLRRDNLVR